MDINNDRKVMMTEKVLYTSITDLGLIHTHEFHEETVNISSA